MYHKLEYLIAEKLWEVLIVAPLPNPGVPPNPGRPDDEDLDLDLGVDRPPFRGLLLALLGHDDM
jgi:hypothetical protein